MISSFVKFFFTLIGNLTNSLWVNNNGIVLLDAPEPWQIGFQDAATPGFEGIVALHDSILFYLVLILVSVLWILFSIINNFNSTKSGITYKYLNHGTNSAHLGCTAFLMLDKFFNITSAPFAPLLLC